MSKWNLTSYGDTSSMLSSKSSVKRILSSRLLSASIRLIFLLLPRKIQMILASPSVLRGTFLLMRGATPSRSSMILLISVLVLKSKSKKRKRAMMKPAKSIRTSAKPLNTEGRRQVVSDTESIVSAGSLQKPILSVMFFSSRP